MKQYEIWWADLPEPVGRRPVLLMARDAAYRYLSWVLVVEITTNARDIPVELALGRAEGLPRASVASFDNLHVVPKSALTARVGTLKIGRVAEVKRAMGYALDWPELKEI